MIAFGGVIAFSILASLNCVSEHIDYLVMRNQWRNTVGQCWNRPAAGVDYEMCQHPQSCGQNQLLTDVTRVCPLIQKWVTQDQVAVVLLVIRSNSR